MICIGIRDGMNKGFNPSIQPMAYRSESNRLFNAAKRLFNPVFLCAHRNPRAHQCVLTIKPLSIRYLVVSLFHWLEREDVNGVCYTNLNNSSNLQMWSVRLAAIAGVLSNFKKFNQNATQSNAVYHPQFQFLAHRGV